MRYPEWPSLLQAELSSTKDFEWGVNDCTSWSFKVISSISNIDYTGYIDELYSNKVSALRLLAKQSLLLYTIDLLGEPRDNILNTKRGDLVLDASNPGGDTLGICIGSQAAFLGLSGLVYLPLKNCKCSWEIK